VFTATLPDDDSFQSFLGLLREAGQEMTCRKRVLVYKTSAGVWFARVREKGYEGMSKCRKQPNGGIWLGRKSN
jgi:hypothetical protein